MKFHTIFQVQISRNLILSVIENTSEANFFMMFYQFTRKTYHVIYNITFSNIWWKLNILLKTIEILMLKNSETILCRLDPNLMNSQKVNDSNYFMSDVYQSTNLFHVNLCEVCSRYCSMSLPPMLYSWVVVLVFMCGTSWYIVSWLQVNLLSTQEQLLYFWPAITVENFWSGVTHSNGDLKLSMKNKTSFIWTIEKTYESRWNGTVAYP